MRITVYLCPVRMMEPAWMTMVVTYVSVLVSGLDKIVQVSVLLMLDN